MGWVLISVCLYGLLHTTVTRADFIVQPMKISETSEPGKLIHTTLKLENHGQERYRIAVKTTDLTQDEHGRWMPDPNALDVNRSDLVTMPSCRSWLYLGTPEDQVITVEPNDTESLDVNIDVPIDSQGTYWAAVKFSLLPEPGSDVSVRYDFVVPVILEIKEIEDTEGDAPVEMPAPVRHFAVYPTIHSFQSRAGESIKTTLHLESLLQDGFQRITIETIDLVPGKDGQWLPIGPDPDRVVPLHTSSCRDWISLGDYPGKEIPVRPLGLQSVDVEINVPPDKQGRFYAGIKATLFSDDKKDLYTNYEFIIPVFMEVKETAETDHSDHTHQPLAMIKCEKPLRITQDEYSDDPYHTYSGQYTIEVCSNLTAHVNTSIVALSAAEGIWTAIITPKTIIYKQKVDIMVHGTDVMIENLTGGKKRVKIVGLTVTVMPDLEQFNVTALDKPNVSPTGTISIGMEYSYARGLLIQAGATEEIPKIDPPIEGITHTIIQLPDGRTYLIHILEETGMINKISLQSNPDPNISGEFVDVRAIDL